MKVTISKQHFNTFAYFTLPNMMKKRECQTKERISRIFIHNKINNQWLIGSNLAACSLHQIMSYMMATSDKGVCDNHRTHLEVTLVVSLYHLWNDIYYQKLL